MVVLPHVPDGRGHQLMMRDQLMQAAIAALSFTKTAATILEPRGYAWLGTAITTGLPVPWQTRGISCKGLYIVAASATGTEIKKQSAPGS